MCSESVHVVSCLNASAVPGVKVSCEKVFDSSFKRGQAVDLRANQVIKGWTEALVHMPAGSVWEVYIPQQLAYGEREQGQIKPFSVLIFKIELISVGGK